jgi:transposase
MIIGSMERNLSSQATNWREYRRFQAWELYQRGWKQKDIAAAMSLTKGSISQWVKRAKEGGVESLRQRKPPGAPPRLTPEQKAQLPGLLAQGAEAFGFRGDIWTQPRVTELIRRQFQVSYHSSQVGRILKECGWSRQKPVRRAVQRDEEAIQRWREERWPQVKKRL